MEKKRIAFIIQHLTNGGAERTISNLTLALKDEFDITLIIFDGNSVTYPYAGKMIDLVLPPVEGTAGKILNSIKRMIKVKRIRRKEHFDCVISFMFGSNLVNVMTRCGERVIISARNYMSSYGLSKKDIYRERFVAKRATLEIALSKMVEHDLVYNFGIPSKKIKTIYNPCDVERIAKLAMEECDYRFDEKIFYVVSAGRMVKQKGQWHLIKAFSEFHDKVPNSRLLLLGEGEMQDKLKRICSDLELQNSVEFMGFVDNPYKFISRSSCFVLSSLFEGLGNVIIEAMACQVPVISYDCLAGPRELIAPETSWSSQCKEVSWNSCGVLVPAPTMEVKFDTVLEDCDKYLANAMLEVYNNPLKAELCIKKSMERIREFTPQEITAQWSKLF